jgi:hypothetical protein
MSPESPASATSESNSVTSAQEQALACPQNQSIVIEKGFAAAVLASIAGKNLGNVVQSAGFLAYQERFLAESGGSQDPVETLLRQEVLWAHFRVGDLQAQAAAATSAETAAMYTAAAARLMAEVRKSSLALHEVRAAARASQGQGAHQAVASAHDAVSQSATEEKHSGIKLRTNEACHDSAAQPDAHASSDCQPTEQSKTKRPNRRRQAAAA